MQIIDNINERLGDDLVCPRTGRRYEEHDGALREIDRSPATQEH